MYFVEGATRRSVSRGVTASVTPSVINSPKSHALFLCSSTTTGHKRTQPVPSPPGGNRDEGQRVRGGGFGEWERDRKRQGERVTR
jgi:hypothetical protein